MYEDVITSGGEITAIGDFTVEGGAFYLFVAPKSDDAPSIAVLNVKISRNHGNSDCPFVVGMWNPVVINKVNVKSEDLSNYRIFWGRTL